MTREEKADAVKGILDAIYVYMTLTEDEVKYKVQTNYTGHSLYCLISQFTMSRKKIEYHIEYSTIVDLLTLEIHHPRVSSVKYRDKIKTYIKCNSEPQIEWYNRRETYLHRYKYNFNDINLLASLAELMIDISKTKNL